MHLIVLLVVLGVQETISQQQEQVFSALDKADPIDTSKLAFVKVYTGDVDKSDPQKPAAKVVYGFLAREEGDTFTIRFVDSSVRAYKKNGKAPGDLERIDHEPSDFAERARKWLSDFNAADADDHRFYLGMTGIFEPAAEAILWSRACARRGLLAEARALWAAVDTGGEMRKGRGGLRHLPKIEDVIQKVGTGFRHRLSMAFAEESLSWSDLRDRHRTWLVAFGDNKDRERVESTLKGLDQVVQEAEEKKTSPSPRTPKEQIVALIYELRNERWPVEGGGFDGWFLGGPASMPDGTRPSEKLIKLGFDAVGDLIVALDDHRPTRIVRYFSRYGGSFWVRSVRDVVQEVLEEISGLEFHGDKDRDRWKDWHRDVVKNGEEETLAMLAEKGDRLSQLAGRRLLQKWPTRVPAVIKGVRAAKDARLRNDLMMLLTNSKEEAVTSFLLDELMKGPDIAPRVAAAQLLLDRGRRDGIDVFVKEWSSPFKVQDTRQKDLPPEIMEFDRAIRSEEARRAMSKFLITSGDLSAFRSVVKELRDAPATLRRNVLDEIWCESLGELLKRGDLPDRTALETELEAMLIQFLDDRARNLGATYGFSLHGKERSLSAPRDADLAACGLTRYWPQRYAFDPSLPSRARDRQIRVMMNVWRAKNGRPELPEIPIPDVRSKDPEIPKLVKRFTAEGETQKRQALGESLELAGLQALPWIEDDLGRLPSGHKARSNLEALADRLSNLVTVARSVGTDTWSIPAGFASKLAAIQGKSADTGAVLGLMLEAMAVLPDQVGTVELEVDRLADGTGVNVTMTLTPGRPESNSSGGSSYLITSDGRKLGGSGGGGARSGYDDVSDFESFQKSLDAALGLPRRRSFEAIIQLRHH